MLIRKANGIILAAQPSDEKITENFPVVYNEPDSAPAKVVVESQIQTLGAGGLTTPARVSPCSWPGGGLGLAGGVIRLLETRSRFMQRLALWQGPILRLLVSFGVAIERALEISQCDHKAGPAVAIATLEHIMFDE